VSALVTISKLPRTVVCPGSAALPQIETDNAAAGRGNAVHAYLCDIAEGADPVVALAGVEEEHRDACEAIDLSRLPKLTEHAAEVAFAIDVETGRARELGRNIGRDYSQITASEIPGTADIVALLEDGQGVYVGDFKTGRVAVAAAKKNRQMRALALAACRSYGRTYAVVAVITVHDEFVGYDQALIDAFELAEIALELRETLEQVKIAVDVYQRGGLPRIVSGAHCKYCPAFAACPAHTKLVQLLAANPLDVERQVMELLTPKTAARAWALLKQAEEVVSRIRGSLYSWSFQSPIDCGNGLVFGPVQSSRKAIDGPTARNILRERFDDAVADAACEYSTSQTAIAAAIKPYAPERGHAELKREVFALIDAAGGVSTKRSTVVKEHPASQ
jgi:hypothetical protein